MNTFLLDYIPIIIFLGIAIGMASLIMIASWIVAKQNPDEEKLSPYECGFDAFEAVSYTHLTLPTKRIV